MNFSPENIKKLFFLKARFFGASVIATGVDYGLWFPLKHFLFDPVTAHAISYPIAVIVNFLLQKFFIFENRRRLRHTFALAMTFSAIGWGLGVAMMFFLVKIPVLAAWPVLAKIVVTGVLFFYNFYTKRFAFEGRFV